MRFNLVALTGVLFAVVFGMAETVLPKQPSEERPLAERFSEPPASTRILPIIHSQKDRPEEQDRQLQALAARGFGGFAGNVAFEGYVEDETKWPPFLRGVRMAREAGMSLWLYDERGYPSGSAGDLTLRDNPEWAARGLLVAMTNAAGGTAVSLKLPPGRLLLASALPRRGGIITLEEAVDLTSAVKDGQLAWQVPEGEWLVTAMTDDLIFEGTHAAISLAYKKPCIDLLTPEPTARFLAVTHERYAERMGKDLGKYFVSSFTDEPSLQNLWFRPMPYRVLPWSLTIEQEFRKRRGRTLLPLLPALVADAGQEGARARYDFWHTVGELVSENYFGQIQEWCAKHNILSGGHLLMEESLSAHVPLYGDFFSCVRRLDAPSIDCLTSLPPEVPWQIARMIGSVADLEGRTVTMCEVSDHSQRYRPKGDMRPVRVVTEDEIRGTCNRLVWGGINTLTSYYAFDGLSDEQLCRINKHVGRCQTMLRGGHQVADVAVLYPVESLWVKFIPSLRGASDEVAVRRIESVFDAVSAALFRSNRDFTYVDSRTLRVADTEDGVLRHNELRWRVLVLPAADTLPFAAWKKIQRFWRGGGVVIAVGALPTNCEKEQPSPQVQAIAHEIFGAGEWPKQVANSAGGMGIALPAGMSALVPKAIDAVLERDAEITQAGSSVRITRRFIDGHDVYFAINDSANDFIGTITFCGKGVEEQWDPATGSVTTLADGVKVPLRLGAYGSMFFRARKAGSPRRCKDAGKVMLTFDIEPLPDTGTPTVGQGTHVRSEFDGNARDGWLARATLTKAQVDTHLFVSFDYAQPLDLRGNYGLAIDFSVPDGQRTP
ncbi:MAG: glycosyl hydrolase, partial [Kiritimatiellae bacterium]|nr:glycosyl hydrolase [Kiritimatiellia bacterium]